jgi:AhpD family alkylhydroperoxidase
MLPFIEAIKAWDPDLYKIAAELSEKAMAPGALDTKTKMLIALAVDAVQESREGVASVARGLRAMGASEGEIAEALRVAYFAYGNAVLGPSNAAFSQK